MLNDFRYGFRTLRQNPGFALTAIVSIALGIGANASIFSLADGLLFRPLPVPNASQVVTLRSRTPSGTFGDMSYRDFSDYRDQSQSFSGLVAYNLAQFGYAADAKTQPQIKAGLLVSGNFFRVLGTEPRLGRAFTASEDQVPGRDAVLVLGHDLWKSEFSADPSVVGRQVRLNGLDFTVIGVAPESFTGMDQYFHPAFFVPAMMGPRLLATNRDLLTDRGKREFSVKGRLKPGVSIQAAGGEAVALAKSLELLYPKTNRSFGAAVRTEIQTRMDISQGDAMLVRFLFSIVVVALLIACANVANLTLSRGRSRAREMAVRLAIGASRARLVRQLMAESLLIALAGGAVGLIMAQFLVGIISTYQIPSDIPIHLTFQMDERVLWFAIFVSLTCALLFGLVPALQSTKTDLAPALKAGDLDRTRKRFLGRNTLVIAQISGSLILLVAATQLFRAFSYVLARSPGFRTDHLLMMSFDPGLAGYSAEQTAEFYRTLPDRARAVPGVKSAALTFSVPAGTVQRAETTIPDGYRFPPGKESVSVLADVVDANYFRTFGVSILRGRGFVATDRANSRRVAVVNETFDRHYFGRNALGKRFRLNDRNGPWVEIVGVAETGKYLSIVEPPTEFVYLPLSQNPQARMTLLAESYGDPAALAVPLRQMIHSTEPKLPVFGVRTMGDFFEQRSVKLLHFVNGIVGSIGLVGLGLALVGLYALVAYQVARRTREIGIRMAVGADRLQVVKMILKQAAVVGGTGVGIGLVLSFAAGRALSASLGTPNLDPVLFGLVAVGLLLTTMIAAAIPSRRAARVDPMQALRQD